MNPSIDRDQFNSILEEILACLPEEVSEILEEVAIIVEDEPSSALLNEMGIPMSRGTADLCGLHWGIPVSERSFFDRPTLPDRIFLFRGPIYRLAGPRPAALKRQIRITLLHEVGHHFGFDEPKLKELGYD